ncbi:MAG: helix-turn-helix domain-containing protein [Rhabdochlamydiaceae bacterium]
MIKNERQYRISKAQLSEFKEALEQSINSRKPANNASLISLQKAREDGIRSQIDELEAELREYESIWASKREISELRGFDEIPAGLIRARLALGITQKVLGERLGLSEQQIQRYESTDYETASLGRIRQVIDALGLRVSKDLRFPDSSMSLVHLLKRMEEAGIERNFIIKRLLPPSVQAEIQSRNYEKLAQPSALQIAGQIGHIFKWTPDQLFGESPLQIDTSAIGNVRFKLRRGTNPVKLAAYTLYSHYIGLIVLQSVSHLPVKHLPTDPFQIHRELEEKFGVVNAEGCLRYVWSLGVPVIALNDPGAFQGTHFKVDGRNVIIVKQKTMSESRWLFTLFHEFWHAANDMDVRDRPLELEDLENISSTGNKLDLHEQEASLFAGAVLLGRSPDRLIHMSLDRANNNLAALKEAVISVATENHVSVEALANCIAFRLSEEGHEWWGPAENLQKTHRDIQPLAREILLDYVDLSQLSGPDLDLLRRALGFAEALQYG